MYFMLADVPGKVNKCICKDKNMAYESCLTIFSKHENDSIFERVRIFFKIVLELNVLPHSFCYICVILFVALVTTINNNLNVSYALFV